MTILNQVDAGCGKKDLQPLQMTPFQSLKHLFSIKGYEMGLLEMYQDVHLDRSMHMMQERRLILSMCEFVKNELDAKILLMSATLPEFVLKLFSETLEIATTLTMERSELREYTRHRCSLLDGDIYDHIDDIRDRLLNKERVLVVCNTVRQAQGVYDALREIQPRSGWLQSRFTLGDRERIEQEVDSLDLLVGTQAIEVSLDIDYDVCYTEPAPMDALIQRFGRVNRKREKDLCGVCLHQRVRAGYKPRRTPCRAHA